MPAPDRAIGRSQAVCPQHCVRERLWLWGHPAGVYNDSYLAPLGKKSTIEPVAAAELMGIRNMIFVRYNGNPRPPFEAYYEPFKRLDRVYWSLVGAGGATSEEERRHVIRLAEQNENLAGFILDDFFHARPRTWLAANRPKFPVTLVIKPPEATTCQQVELVQTDWHTGDYRSKSVTVEISLDGQRFTVVQEAELPNEPGKALRVTLPTEPFRMLRVQVRSTHDTQGAISCGMKSVRFLRNGEPLDLQRWQAEASSQYPGFPAEGALEDGVRYDASLSPEQLRALGERQYRGKRLPITAVVYVRQISPWLRPYLGRSGSGEPLDLAPRRSRSPGRQPQNAGRGNSRQTGTVGMLHVRLRPTSAPDEETDANASRDGLPLAPRRSRYWLDLPGHAQRGRRPGGCRLDARLDSPGW